MYIYKYIGGFMLQGMPEIGAQYAEKCKAKVWTQADAATRADLARPVISMIERGRFTGSLKSLVAYLSVLGLALSVNKTNIPQFEQLEDIFNDD